MTIYTPSVNDKKSDKDLVDPEVVTKPLTSFKDDDAEDGPPKLVRVTYFPHSRKTFCIHLLLTIMVLVILACGAIGAVVFYRHLHKKQVYSGRCGTVYFDTAYHEQPQAVWAPKTSQEPPKMDYFEEMIEVSLNEKYESLYTPRFDEVRETYVWHDFQNNYTALIEHNWKLCYVMKLNRTQIAPPRDLVDLISKIRTGYYLPEARVLKENYRVVLPALTDLRPFGPGIGSKCQLYQTFWLMKYRPDQREKRSVTETEEAIATYALMTNHPSDQTIIKMRVHTGIN